MTHDLHPDDYRQAHIEMEYDPECDKPIDDHTVSMADPLTAPDDDFADAFMPMALKADQALMQLMPLSSMLTTERRRRTWNKKVELIADRVRTTAYMVEAHRPGWAVHLVSFFKDIQRARISEKVFTDHFDKPDRDERAYAREQVKAYVGKCRFSFFKTTALLLGVRRGSMVLVSTPDGSGAGVGVVEKLSLSHTGTAPYIRIAPTTVEGIERDPLSMWHRGVSNRSGGRGSDMDMLLQPVSWPFPEERVVRFGLNGLVRRVRGYGFDAPLPMAMRMMLGPDIDWTRVNNITAVVRPPASRTPIEEIFASAGLV